MPLIKTIATRKKKSGNYKISVPVGDDPENTVTSVQVVISYNPDQPVPEPSTVILTTVNNVDEDRVFSGDIQFSEDAVGQIYTMVATMEGAEGSIGTPFRKAVTVTAANVPTEA
jgi:hypothetical protein